MQIKHKIMNKVNKKKTILNLIREFIDGTH